jgi:hypothetical protein
MPNRRKQNELVTCVSHFLNDIIFCAIFSEKLLQRRQHFDDLGVSAGDEQF